MYTERLTARGAVSHRQADEESRDVQFVEMLRAFRRSGGLARETEILERRSACRSSGPPDERFHGAIICFEWGGRFWLPWFQFDRIHMSLRPGPARVIEELAQVFDGWEMAVWFTQPNLWIEEARPIDRIDKCLASVLGAARADRFIAAAARPEKVAPRASDETKSPRIDRSESR
jgi:hypothetical protein